MKADHGPENGIKTTATVFRIIELLREEDGLRLTELADEVDMAKSSVHRHLSSLLANGYVIKEDGHYYPGMKFLDLGEYVRNRKESYRLVKPKVTQLAEQTNERSEFIVEEHGYGIFVHREIGEHAVTTDTRIGKRIPLHASSAGKAILAYLPKERVDEIIDRRGLSRETERTITDREELLAELEKVRERGVAFNRQEIITGLRAVGVPIREPDGRVLGALSISGPTGRLKGEVFTKELPDLLLGVANEVELNLEYS